MTRKDYEAIAEIIRRHAAGNPALVMGLAYLFKSRNPNFKIETFVNACAKKEVEK